MTLSFPNNPQVGDVYQSWFWTGEVWKASSGSGGGGANIISQETAPSNPAFGDLWFNTELGILLVYYSDGTSNQWVDVSTSSTTTGASGASVTVQDTPPGSATEGDLWFDAAGGTLYIFTESVWVDTSAGSTGSRDFCGVTVNMSNLSACGPTGVLSISGDVDLGSGTLSAADVHISNNSLIFESGAQITSNVSGDVEIVPGAGGQVNLQGGIDTGDITSGTLPVNRGGTGATSHASGEVLVGNSTNAVSTISRNGIDSRSTFPPSTHSHSTSDITDFAFANNIGQHDSPQAAESSMTTNGTYEWYLTGTSSDLLFTSIKSANGITHLPKILTENDDFIVGNQPGDHFDTPQTASVFLNYCVINAHISITVEIRAGTYQITTPIRGHQDGNRIYYKPITGATPTYPVESDFTGVSATDITMLRSKYPVVIENNGVDVNSRRGIFCQNDQINIQDCLFIGLQTPERAGVEVTENGHADVEGCCFAGFSHGVKSYNNSDVRCPNTTAAHNTVNGFDAEVNSSFRASTSPVNSFYNQKGFRIMTGSNLRIDNIHVAHCSTTGVEIAHGSQCVESSTITFTIDDCGEGITVRRNSTIKISDTTLTNIVEYPIRVFGGSYAYVSDPGTISAPTGSNPDRITCDTGAYMEIYNILGTSLETQTNKTMSPTGVGSEKAGGDNIYGTILMKS